MEIKIINFVKEIGVKSIVVGFVLKIRSLLFKQGPGVPDWAKRFIFYRFHFCVVLHMLIVL